MAVSDAPRKDGPARTPEEQGVPPRRVFAARYEVVSELGRGAMGQVLRAHDLKLGRDVALKLLAPGASEEQRLRFQQEARAAGALNHPNILDVHDVGEEKGEPFIVTELLEGETLRTVLSRGPLASRYALELATQLAQGLSAAHAAGIVHRDIKPDNLFITTDGHLKILDFGIAKLREGSAPTAVRTENGVSFGTPGYMSPEQVEGRPATARSDIFAFGAVLHEMLAGSGPFNRRTPWNPRTPSSATRPKRCRPRRLRRLAGWSRVAWRGMTWPVLPTAVSSSRNWESSLRSRCAGVRGSGSQRLRWR